MGGIIVALNRDRPSWGDSRSERVELTMIIQIGKPTLEELLAILNEIEQDYEVFIASDDTQDYVDRIRIDDKRKQVIIIRTAEQNADQAEKEG